MFGFPETPEAFTVPLLKNGKLLILLDGVDEVPSNISRNIIGIIENFVDTYDQNRFVISCRSAAYLSSLRPSKDIVIAEFEDTQIEQFINNWFRSKTDDKKLWDELQKPNNEHIKILAKTPLLLTYLCLVYGDSEPKTLPKNRSDLYKEVLDILLKDWSIQKQNKKDPIYKTFPTRLEKKLLSEIAYQNFEKDRLLFPEDEILNRITTFLSENPRAPQDLDASEVLNAIEVEQGILVKQKKRVGKKYSFSHLTLQEYLSAQYIGDHHQINHLVAKHLIDERWREVFLLVAGLIEYEDRVDNLLLEMEKQVHTYITKTSNLERLLDRINSATASLKGKYTPGAKRAGAIALTLIYNLKKTIKNAQNIIKYQLYGIDRAIKDSKAYARGLEIALDLSCNLDSEFSHTLEAVYDLVLNLKQNFSEHNLSKASQEVDVIEKTIEEAIESSFASEFKPMSQVLEPIHLPITELTNYLYANLLMVQCHKQEAELRSCATWEDIEERMLQIQH